MLTARMAGITMAPMTADRDAQIVLGRYDLTAGQVRHIEALGNAGGWSGSLLWRVTAADGRQLCLKRWPQSNRVHLQLRFVHDVLLRVARELPPVACPVWASDGTTYVEYDSHLWELTLWRPGDPDNDRQPRPARAQAAMQTLAWFHRLAADSSSGVFPIVPAICERWKEYSYHRFGHRSHAGLTTIERSLQRPLRNEIDVLSPLLFAMARRALESPDFWQKLGDVRSLWVQPAIRDVHRAHVLFTGDEVTGLIDFGAMRNDTPLTDIGRLLGSLVGGNQDLRRLALDAYAETRPISDADRVLVDFFDESGIVLAGLNWLTWLYVDRRDMGPTEPILKRLNEIIARLEHRA